MPASAQKTQPGSISLFGGQAAANGTSQTQTPTDEKPKSQVWLNIGINVPTPNGETGEVEDVFVSIGGIAIDTAKEVETKGSSVRFAQLVQAKNWLMSQLQDAGATLEPGQAVCIDDLQLELRRVGTPPVPSAGENPLLTALASRFSVVK